MIDYCIQKSLTRCGLLEANVCGSPKMPCQLKTRVKIITTTCACALTNPHVTPPWPWFVTLRSRAKAKAEKLATKEARKKAL